MATTNNYFNNCKTSEELKATYKALVKKYHPDVYGEKGNDILWSTKFIKMVICTLNSILNL